MRYALNVLANGLRSVASNYFTVAGAAERQRLPVFLAFVFKVRQGGSRINVEEVRKGKTACTVCLSVCCPNKLARRGDVRHRHYYHYFGPLSLARARESIWCPEMASHQKRRTML